MVTAVHDKQQLHLTAGHHVLMMTCGLPTAIADLQKHFLQLHSCMTCLLAIRPSDMRMKITSEVSLTGLNVVAPNRETFL